MDTANLIEEAERWAKNVSESPGNGTAGEDLYGAKLLCDLAAALKASEEQNGAIRRGLDWERAEREKVAEFARKIGRERDDLAAALKASEERARKAEKTQEQLYDEWREELRVSERERDAIAAANLAANKRIVELEHERDAACAELARLTTPRPIVEAPTDKPVLGIWIDHRGNKCVEVLRWCGYWHGSDGTPLYREAEYLPLPKVKP